MQFYYAGTEEMQVDHANMMRQFLLVTGLPLILRKDVEINKNVNIIFYITCRITWNFFINLEVQICRSIHRMIKIGTINVHCSFIPWYF